MNEQKSNEIHKAVGMALDGWMDEESGSFSVSGDGFEVSFEQWIKNDEGETIPSYCQIVITNQNDWSIASPLNFYLQEEHNIKTGAVVNAIANAIEGLLMKASESPIVGE